MSVGKLSSDGTLTAMKSSEGTDFLDTFIRQSVGNDPFLPFSRPVNTTVPWTLFHALDYPDMPGWPFLTPMKAQMQKCEKCSWEFASSINYRRHTRAHRRSFNVNKEPLKNRELLAAFWDKLSLEEAKGAISFDDVMLKELPGSTIIRALASSLQKAGVWTLPQVYVKSGSTLLDIIQAKPSGLPISSKELFNVLDDASESTFLCGGTADAVQKFVLDEDPKNCLKLKNLIAATSFLFEKQLVKAWLADKDAEALRCQKLLVEEEEAAQKRQAQLLERKRKKKLRQKVQKVKEQFNERNGDSSVEVDAVDRPASAEESAPMFFSDSNTDTPYLSENLDSRPESSQPQSEEPNGDIEAQLGFSNEHIDAVDSQITDLHMVRSNGRRHEAAAHQQVLKLQRDRRKGFSANRNVRVYKPEPTNKFGPSKDRAVVNKVWTRKLKINSDKENLKSPSVHEDVSIQVEDNCHEVMIGSIPITLKTGVSQQLVKCPCKPPDTLTAEHPVGQKKFSEKPSKTSNVQSGPNLVVSKRWRPVSRVEPKGTPPFGRENEGPEPGSTLKKVQERVLSNECSAELQSSRKNDLQHGKDNLVHGDESLQGNNLTFSSAAAREFLAQRWKEAISSDHVVLVLSPEREPSNADVQEQRGGQVKFRQRRVEKNPKTKYIPKQKSIA